MIRLFYLHSRHFNTPTTLQLPPLRYIANSTTHLDHSHLHKLHESTKPMTNVDDLESLHVWLIKSGYESDRFLVNGLVNGYAKLGELVLARKMFDGMPDRNTVSWTCLISGFSQRGLPRQACELFRCMVSSGFCPTEYSFGSVLQACRNYGSGLLNLGAQIHGMSCKMGYEFDSVVGNALIAMYGSCSYDPIDNAVRVFQDTPKENVVSWNSIISVCSKQGDIVSVLELFSAMQKMGSDSRLRPNEFSFGSAIAAVNSCLFSEPVGINVFIQLLAGVVKYGFLSNLFVSSVLVSASARVGLVEMAKDIFSKMPHRNAVSLNGLMVGLVKQERGEEAMETFKDASGLIEVNEECYVTLLSACCSEFDLPEEGRRKGREIHGLLVRNGMNSCSAKIGNGLVNMYAKCAFINDAHSVFKLMEVKDQISWNSIITGFDQNWCCKEALLKFREMRRSGMTPANFAIISSLSSCESLRFATMGLQLHSEVTKSGLHMDISVCNSLITMYGECGHIQNCWQVFNTMYQHDSISWNCMIGALACSETSIPDTMAVILEMLRMGWIPDKITFINILSVVSHISSLELGRQFHVLILKYGYAEDRSVENALLSCYAKCREMNACECLFNSMSNRRDDVSWNSMLAGYVQNDLFAKAMSCMRSMMQRGKKIDCFAISTALSACAAIAELERGMELHAFGIKSFMGSDVVVDSSLVDMYSKCGKVNYACHVFSSMPSKNEFSWNSMISGFARHGYATKALDLFKEMQDEGHHPDHITYIGVLSACSHAGLVEEGLDYFESMSTKCGLIPRMEHYSCMVDLLGRAGKLREIKNFIKGMPVHPNVLVWRTVLSACCRVKSSDSIILGRQAGEILLELEPQNPVNHLLLCHLYASKGRWEDVTSTRASMNSMPNRKEAGCSWVTLKDGLHIFVSGDKSHPETEAIYAELRVLNKRIRDVGYVPKTDFPLYDLEEEEKEELLSHHSEKLAIAFMLTRPSKLPIRIIKNLRICGDCHSAFGYISKVIRREIVLRDSNRFHHFKEGNCSCGDYW